jgi:hypothetical protein
MAELSAFEFPSAYYYLFQALVMGRRSPSGYLPRPLRPLGEREAEALLSSVRGIVGDDRGSSG